MFLFAVRNSLALTHTFNSVILAFLFVIIKCSHTPVIPVEMMYAFLGYLHASVSVVFYSFGAGRYLSISLRVQ